MKHIIEMIRKAIENSEAKRAAELDNLIMSVCEGQTVTFRGVDYLRVVTNATYEVKHTEKNGDVWSQLYVR